MSLFPRTGAPILWVRIAVTLAVLVAAGGAAYSIYRKPLAEIRRGLPPHVVTPFLTAVGVAFAVFVIVFLFYLLRKRRRLGRILLTCRSVGRRRMRLVTLGFGLLCALQLFLAFFWSINAAPALLSGGLFLFYVSYLFFRMGVYDGGLAAAGGFFEWNELTSYHWDAEAGLLYFFRRESRWHAAPPVIFRIMDNQRDGLERLLSRKLHEKLAARNG